MSKSVVPHKTEFGVWIMESDIFKLVVIHSCLMVVPFSMVSGIHAGNSAIAYRIPVSIY